MLEDLAVLIIGTFFVFIIFLWICWPFIFGIIGIKMLHKMFFKKKGEK